MENRNFLNRIIKSKAGAITCVYFVIALVLCLFALKKARGMDEYNFDFSECSITTDESEWAIESDYYMLNEGSYVFEVAYVSDIDASVALRADNDTNIAIDMPASPSGNVASGTFTLKFPSDCGKVRISAPGEISLVSMKLTADHRIYTDWLWLILFLIGMVPVVWMVGNRLFESGTEESKSIWDMSRTQIEMAGVIAIMALSCASIWLCGKVPMAGDVRSHLQRIQGIYMGLKSGQFPVVIYPNQVNCFGQAGVLYPNVLLYIPGVLRYLGMSLFGAYKVLDSLVAIATVLVAYHISKRFFNDYRYVLLSTMLYSLGNSRFRVQLWGCSGGYGVAMIFIPLIVYGLYTVFYEEDKRWEYLAFGFAGVVSSHVITTVITVIVAVLFTLMHVNKVFKKDVFMALLKAVGAFFMMTLMVLVPFVRYYSLGINRSNLSWSSFIGSLWTPLELLDPENQLTEIVLVVLVIAMIVIAGKGTEKILSLAGSDDNGLRVFCTKSFILYIACTWLETTIFPWKLIDSVIPVDDILSSVQQADRIRYSTFFFIIVVFVYVLKEFVKHVKASESRNCRVFAHAVSIVVIALVMYTVAFSYVKQYKFAREEAAINDFVTGSVETKVDADYLPAGTEDEDYVYAVGNVSDENKVNSFFYEKRGIDVYYAYSTESEGEYAEFPLLYYEGYEAHVVNNKEEFLGGAKAALGDKLEVQNGDRNHVRVTLPATAAETMIKVSFRVSPVYLVCVIISILSILCCVWMRRVNDN